MGSWRSLLQESEALSPVRGWRMAQLTGKCACEGGHPRLEVTAQISALGGHLLALPKQTCLCEGRMAEEVGLGGQLAYT